MSRLTSRLVIGLVVLLLLVFGADRVASTLVARSVGQALQSSQSLPVPPTVTFIDVPFLDQVARGRYSRLELEMSKVRTAGPLVIDHVTATLYGVRAEASDVVRGSLRELPVERARAEAFVSFGTLRVAARQILGSKGADITLGRASADRVSFDARSPTSAGTFALRGEAQLVMEKGLVRMRVLPETLTGVPEALRSQVASQVDLSTLVPALPYGLKATTVVIEPEGLRLQAVGRGLRIPF
ncbi:MAG: hypothetical protein QG622_2485 [Actinomycetota bacterium]|nr:hypothetical protein [Actinomycetota bacterium]